ncbi:MAG: TadE/TadG family type IV pilus assembly protein [Woeseiaceae bacterium]|nr:TadE/TadG family type IV pilus assembly protein [Woeseiaceae bacterium]
MVKRKRHQHGIASVELTLIAPVLLFMLMAVAEGGRAFLQHNAISKSIRNAVRHVADQALVGTGSQVVISPTLAAEARNLAVYGSIGGSGSAMLPGLTTGDISVINAGGGDITIRADYNYSPMLGAVLPDFGFGPDRNMNLLLRAEVTMSALQR